MAALVLKRFSCVLHKVDLKFFIEI